MGTEQAANTRQPAECPVDVLMSRKVAAKPYHAPEWLAPAHAGAGEEDDGQGAQRERQPGRGGGPGRRGAGRRAGWCVIGLRV